MAVKKRYWTTAKGEEKSAWVVDYRDATRKRRQKTFEKKKDADAFAASTKIQLKDGTHIPDRAGVSVADAGKLWLEAVTDAGRERTTIDQYRQHLNLHIVPFLGETKLGALTIPLVRSFESDLRDNGRSPAMVKKVLVSLGSLLADARERGLVSTNVMRDVRATRGKTDRRAEKRNKGRLKIGVDVPTREEVKALLGAVAPRYRAAIVLAAFTGMRSSEIRGLRWTSINLNSNNLHVHERVDRHNNFGPPKSDSGERMIPIPPPAIEALKAWRRECPKGELNLAFPHTKGGVLSHTQLQRDGFEAGQVAAGITRIGADKSGKPVTLPKYTGLHALRHWFASWCINRVADGGRELPAKQVQGLLGHSSITMTLDTYGHLFPEGNDREELQRATSFFMDSDNSGRHEGDIGAI